MLFEHLYNRRYQDQVKLVVERSVIQPEGSQRHVAPEEYGPAGDSALNASSLAEVGGLCPYQNTLLPCQNV